MGTLHAASHPRMLRLKQVEDRVGFKKSKLYDDMEKGLFPQSVPLGPRAIGWLESEINDWIADKVEQRRSGGK